MLEELAAGNLHGEVCEGGDRYPLRAGSPLLGGIYRHTVSENRIVTNSHRDPARPFWNSWVSLPRLFPVREVTATKGVVELTAGVG